MVVFGSAWPSLSCLTLSEVRKESSRVEQELERWQRTNIQLTPKVKPTGGFAGRPMLSAQEKQFREQVRYIDEIYLSLENDFATQPGALQRLFGRQMDLYREAVAAQDYQTVNWWKENSPWRFKNPPDFEKFWNDRAKNDPPERGIQEEAGLPSDDVL